MSIPNHVTKIKQCKTIGEVARLMGEGSEGAILHILMLRDIENLQAEQSAIKKTLRSLSSCITDLEIQLTEVQKELGTLNRFC
jgi:hypothetical protein